MEGERNEDITVKEDIDMEKKVSQDDNKDLEDAHDNFRYEYLYGDIETNRENKHHQYVNKVLDDDIYGDMGDYDLGTEIEKVNVI